MEWNGAVIKGKSRISLPSKPSIHFARVIVRFDTFYHDSFRSSSLGIKKSNLGGGCSSWPSKGRKIVGRRKKMSKKCRERREEKSKPSENESPKLAHRILNEATAAEGATRPSNFSEHDFFHLVLVLFSLSIDDFLVLPSNNLWKLCS